MVEVKEKIIGQVEKVISCQIGWQRGQCKNGHKFVKVLLCGVEWCETCGAESSWLHKRRISYWWQKIMQMKDIGYMVITIPSELWGVMKYREALQRVRRYWVRKLKRMGYERGLSRWHFSSEQKKYKEWYPHLNLLFEGKYLENLDEIKNDWLKWLRKNFFYHGEVVDIYYHYFVDCSIEKKIHLLKYITRSTMRWFDVDLAKQVYYNFHNMISWGKWQKEKESYVEDNLMEEDKKLVQEMKNIEKLSKGICCKCGADIIWVGYSRIVWFSEDSEEIGGGYYYVGCDPPRGWKEWISEWIDKQKREIKYSRKKRDFYSWYDDK